MKKAVLSETHREIDLGKKYYEMIGLVGRDFQEINRNFDITYENLDLRSSIRDDHEDFWANAIDLAKKIYDQTSSFLLDGFFLHKRKKKIIQDDEFVIKNQKGILRTNCVDCLDRTNLFQGIIADTVLERQINEILQNKIIEKNTIESSLLTSILEKFITKPT